MRRPVELVVLVTREKLKWLTRNSFFTVIRSNFDFIRCRQNDKSNYCSSAFPIGTAVKITEKIQPKELIAFYWMEHKIRMIKIWGLDVSKVRKKWVLLSVNYDSLFCWSKTSLDSLQNTLYKSVTFRTSEKVVTGDHYRSVFHVWSKKEFLGITFSNCLMSVA